MVNFECDGNRNFFKYWQSLPRDGLVPESKYFLPEEIPEILPFIVIYELISEECIRFRLTGTMIDNRDGKDNTGKNYLDEVAPARRPKASKAFFAAYNQPCGMKVIINIKKESGLMQRVESFGLPMINSRSGSPLLYYANYVIESQKSRYDLKKDDRLELIDLEQREFIDLGAGVPNFTD